VKRVKKVKKVKEVKRAKGVVFHHFTVSPFHYVAILRAKIGFIWFG